MHNCTQETPKAKVLTEIPFGMHAGTNIRSLRILISVNKFENDIRLNASHVKRQILWRL